MPSYHIWIFSLGVVWVLVNHEQGWGAEQGAPARDTESFYDPIPHQLEGWSIAVDPQLFRPEHEQDRKDAFEALANHLQRIKYILPEDRFEKLQRLPIWLEFFNEQLGNMQYHPDREWLIEHGHDPRLAKHVHIPRADQLTARDMWAKHPYVILHELAHAYHDQVLSFEQPEILDAFEQAKSAKKYEQVLLYTGKQVPHYGLSNHKEYFAETTEAYLGVNDFYPFVRAELRLHDPLGFRVMEQVWGPIGKED